MLEGKAVVGETDMLQNMQQDALHLAAKALDIFDVTESTDIARFIKKVTSWKVLDDYLELNN
jgi:dynein light chain LC8-type